MNEGPRAERRAVLRSRARRRTIVVLTPTALLLAAAGTLSLAHEHGGARAGAGAPSARPDRTVTGAEAGTGASAGTGPETPTAGAKPVPPAGSAGPARSAAPAEPPGTLTLAFAGDVHFTGRTAGRLVVQPALGPMARQLAAADFSMVNLESAITGRGAPQAKLYHFRTTPAALTALRDSGVDAVSMANNHAVDYGLPGLADSIAAKHTGPLPVLGIGADDAEAFRPYTATLHGVRLAVLAASQVDDLTNADFRAGPGTPGIASALDRPRLLAAVRAARAHADVVVVYLHWGVEGARCPVADQVSVAAELSAAGATVVVGTHAHVMLGSGMLGPTYVAYGFGNFLWYGTSPYPDSDETGVTTLTVTRAGRVTAARFTPGLIDAHGVAEPQSGAAADRITSRYVALRACTGLAAPPKP